MAFLWILLGILVLILLVCAIPLLVRIRYEEQFSITVKLGLWTLWRTPKPVESVDLRDFSYQKHQKRLKTLAEKKRKKQLQAQKKQEKEKKSPKKNPAAKLEQATTDSNQNENKLTGILSLVKIILNALPGFLGKFRCRIYTLEVTVGGKDVAETAFQYGILSQSLAYLLAFLEQKTILVPTSNPAPAIRADFLSASTSVRADLSLQIPVGQGIGFLLTIIKSKFLK